MNKLKATFILTALLALQAALGISLASAAVHYRYRGTIPGGVTINGLDVKGMTAQVALKFLSQKYPHLNSNSDILLQGPDGWAKEIRCTDINLVPNYQGAVDRAINLGKTVNSLGQIRDLFKLYFKGIDIPITANFDQAKMGQVLAAVNQSTRVNPEDAQVAYDNGNITLLPETRGRVLDIEATIAKAKNMPFDTPRFDLVYKKTEPAITLEKIKQINSRLGIYATSFSLEDNDRAHNIELASNLVNEQLVQPGQVFSLNKTLGQRDAANGYMLAPVIIGNHLAQDYGGGVCQMATTLYNAVVAAKLKVVERIGHTMPVEYAPPGKDATIAGDYIDFKFENDSPEPILITSRVIPDSNNPFLPAGAGKLLVSIYGHAGGDNQTIYKMDTEKTVIEPKTVFKVNPQLSPGEINVLDPGREGYDINVYELKLTNNKLVSRKLVSSTHTEPLEAIIEVSPTLHLPGQVDK